MSILLLESSVRPERFLPHLACKHTHQMCLKRSPMRGVSHKRKGRSPEARGRKASNQFQEILPKIEK